jgi:hypothetical protein
LSPQGRTQSTRSKTGGSHFQIAIENLGRWTPYARSLWRTVSVQIITTDINSYYCMYYYDKKVQFITYKKETKQF